MLQRGYSYPRKATRTRTPVVVRLAHKTCPLCNSRIPFPFTFHPAAKRRRQQIFAYLAGLAGGQTNGYLLKRESCWDLHRRARVLSASAPPAPGSNTPPSITVPPTPTGTHSSAPLIQQLLVLGPGTRPQAVASSHSRSVPHPFSSSLTSLQNRSLLIR